LKAFEIVVRETFISSANDARVARRRGVGLTFGEATVDRRLRPTRLGAVAAPGRRLVAHSGPVAILAVLIGSNIGPMLLCRNQNR
jgi:hypothetical protein